ncbi:MAG: vWA domain-containing protein [Polyangiales bacterium]
MSSSAVTLTLVVSCLALTGCVQSPQPALRSDDDAVSVVTAGSAAEPAMSDAPVVPSATDNPAPGLLPPPVPDAGMAVKDSGPPDAGAAIDPSDCMTGKFCPIRRPDDTLCGTLELTTDIRTQLKRASILVVFDRSGSMEGLWGGVPKYQSAGRALVAALTPLASQLTVGGVFFPSPMVNVPINTSACPNGCEPLNLQHWIPGIGGCCLNSSPDSCPVNRIEAGDQLDFMPAQSFITALPQQWSLNDPSGSAGTPLERGIARAAEAIDRGMLTDPPLVLVMTDGEPNCGTVLDNVIDQVADWKTLGISTYVVGLPGAQPAAQFLTQVAKAGGTDTFIDPKNPEELEARLRAVISSSVREGFSSCTFPIEPKAAAPEKLKLVVTEMGKELVVPRDARWTINPTGDLVTLEGELCRKATAGAYEALRFEFGCPDPTPPEPPPPQPIPE